MRLQIYMSTTTPIGTQSIQFELLNKFRTGNPIYDAIISTMIFSLVASTTGSIPSIFMFCKNILMKSNYLLYLLLTKLFSRKNKTMNKEVVIDYITDTKKVNELFQAVQYYIANNNDVDYIKETPLKLTYETKIERDSTSLDSIKNIHLNKFITHNKTKLFTYKNHEIKYYINKDIITVFTDKERKKENYTITLSTTMPDDSKTDILSDFCTHCMSEYIKSIIGRAWEQLIYINKNGKWESQPSHNKRKIDTIILHNGNKEEIMTDLHTFLQSEDWYNCRDIPYTRGYLFYGRPGTGKTSLIKGISTYCKRHIHYLMLRDIKDDNELLELMRQINYHETILVIEDVDCTTDIIKDRRIKQEKTTDSEKLEELEKKLNKLQKEKNGQTNGINIQHDTPNNRITLSGLLNSIDGVFNNDGRILIMTTNHPEVLDEALIRPGRIDKKILFDNCDKKQIVDLYTVFFGEKCDESLLDEIEDKTFSPAYISSLFLQYRNHPQDALRHLNKLDDHPTVEPMVKSTTPSSQPKVENEIEHEIIREIQQTNTPAVVEQIDKNQFLTSNPDLFLQYLKNMPIRDSTSIDITSLTST